MKEAHKPGVYDTLNPIGLIKTAIEADSKDYDESWNKRKATVRRNVISVYGVPPDEELNFSPSTSSNCVRWEGYQKLGYEGTPMSFGAKMATMIGRASHDELAKILRRNAPGRHNVPTNLDSEGVYGVMDWVFNNPILHKEEVIDWKFVASFKFKQINRDGLHELLRNTKNIYNPEPEYRRQLLLYMYDREKRGKEVACGVVVYVNRDNPEQMKPALIIWDAVAKYDAEQFLKEIQEAKLAVKEGQIPKENVISPYICRSMCPHVQHCEPGQAFAQRNIRRKRKVMPEWVYKKQREEFAQRQERLQELGIIPLPLPGFEDAVNADPKAREPFRRKK
jgi:hypothetical protein